MADGDGARSAYQAGYDPREMAKLFLLVGKQQKKQGGPVPTFFQSHPEPQSRHDAVIEDLFRNASRRPRITPSMSARRTSGCGSPGRTASSRSEEFVRFPR